MRRLLCLLAAAFMTGASMQPGVDTMVLNQLESVLAQAGTQPELLSGLRQTYGIFEQRSDREWQLKTRYPDTPFRAITIWKEASDDGTPCRLTFTLRQPETILNLTHKANSWRASVPLPDTGRVHIGYTPHGARFTMSAIVESGPHRFESPINEITAFWQPLPTKKGVAH